MRRQFDWENCCLEADKFVNSFALESIGYEKIFYKLKVFLCIYFLLASTKIEILKKYILKSFKHYVYEPQMF